MRLIFVSCCDNEKFSGIDIMSTHWGMKGEGERAQILDALRESSFFGDRLSPEFVSVHGRLVASQSWRWNESPENQLWPDPWPRSSAAIFPRRQWSQQILLWISEIYGDDSGWRVIPPLLHTVIRTWTLWEHKFAVVTVIPVNVGRLLLPL